MPYWLKRRLKKTFFCYRHFLIAVFVDGEQFSRTSKAFYYRPIPNIACCQKSGGVIGRLFRVIRHQIGVFRFFLKLCAVCITTAVSVLHPPPFRSWAHRMGCLWRAAAPRISHRIESFLLSCVLKNELNISAF
jgi:hypothetical protein